MKARRDRLSNGIKWAALIGLIIAVVILVVGAAEIAIRVRQTLRYGSAATVEDLYTIDPRIGLRVPIANLHSGHIQTNSLGFRGPEIVVPKPPGTVRIAFLGASTTWCGEVSGNEKVWPHLVAAQLRRAYPQATIDYVNGGVPGYTIASSIANLRHRVAPLRPDMIVIYHATNDLSGELRDTAVAKGVIRDSKVQTPLWPSNYSLLWNLAEKNFRIWVAQKKSEANTGRLDVEPSALGNNFRRELTTLVKAAQQQANVVAVATFSSQLRSGQPPEQLLQASASNLYYMPFMTPVGFLRSYQRYNEIIAQVAQATGAVLVSGEDEIPGDRLHFTDTVHFTDAGSEAMADRLSRALLSTPEVTTLLSNSQ